MDLEPYSVAVARGEGLVAFTGHVLMYVADSTGASALLTALDTAGQSQGWTLVKALAGIALGPDSGLVSPFGVLVPADDGLRLILRGPVAAHIETDSGNRTVAGDRALPWVDETLRVPVNTVTISTQDAALNPDPHTDLRAGVVPGGGFVMYRKAKAHSAVRSVTPTAEPPPGLGALCVDDEASYPLDRPYVIGRNPMIDNVVRTGHASALFLPDDPQISRVHAYVTVDAGTVFVRDAGTPGGTFVAAPGDATWRRVGEQPTALEPGWCLRIGQRILMYQKASSAQ